MDALVLPFILALLAEIGSPGQVLAGALGRRFGVRPAVLLGIVVGALGTTALAAGGGAAIGPELPARARGLLLGVALLLIALGRVRSPKPADHGRDWRGLGAFAGSATAFLVVAFGGEVMLAIAALTAGGRSPWLAAPAAALGMTAAAAMPLALGEAILASGAVRHLRLVLSGGFALAGLLLSLSALDLI